MDGVDYLMDRARLTTALIVAIVFISFLVKGLISPSKSISQSLANGTYSSSCCGDVVLYNGLMSFSGGAVHYRLFVIKTDLQAETEDDVVIVEGKKVGLVAGKNNRYVGFWRFPHRDNMMNLYDAANEPPNRLTLYGNDYSGPYDFTLVGK